MTETIAASRGRAGRVGGLAIVLAFALTLGGLVAAGRPTAPGDTIAEYLPDHPVTRLHAGVAGTDVWQVNQGVLPAASAWDELSLLARRHLEPVDEGHWLTVDVLDPAQPAARLSLDFQITGEVVALRTLTTPDRSFSLDPGIAVLSPEMLDGVDTGWEGTLALDDSPAVPATADVHTEISAVQPGCLESSVTIDDSTEILTWCSGTKPGLTGWRTEASGSPTGFTLETGQRENSSNAVDLDDTPTTPLTGDPVLEVSFFRIIAGSYREQLAPRGSRAVWAADQLVIADTEGRVTSWLPIDDTGEPGSYYSQVWRAQPGGSVRSLVSIGAVTILGTTEREVVAYDRDGWELWRHDVPDGVTQMSAHVGLVMVADASGTVSVLDPGTGAERWQTGGVDQILAVGGDPGVVVALSGSTLAVHDLATGARAWSVEVTSRGVDATATGTAVAITTGSWLVVRDAVTGHVRWARAVPTDTLLHEAGGLLLVSEPRTARLIGTDGHAAWTSSQPMPIALPLGDGPEVLGIMLDGLVVSAPDAPDLVWDFPDGVGAPDIEPLRGDLGLITVQLQGGHYRWWEYR